MKHNCPECNAILNFDISDIELILLRIKCNSCGKSLSISGMNKSIETEDKKINMERVKDLIQLAWVDGQLSTNEETIILQKSKSFGIDEDKVKTIMAKHATKTKTLENTLELIKDYDEDINMYLNKNKDFYNTIDFFQRIAELNAEDQNLKQYREDLLRMLEFNSDSWLERAKFWEELYNESNRETEWREAQKNMEHCLELLDESKESIEHVSSMNKKDFVSFAQGVIQKDPDGWD